MMNWYVLFTKTGYETKVTKTLENLFKGLLTPFIPKKEIIFKNNQSLVFQLVFSCRLCSRLPCLNSRVT